MVVVEEDKLMVPHHRARDGGQATDRGGFNRYRSLIIDYLRR